MLPAAIFVLVGLTHLLLLLLWLGRRDGQAVWGCCPIGCGMLILAFLSGGAFYAMADSPLRRALLLAALSTVLHMAVIAGLMSREGKKSLGKPIEVDSGDATAE